MHVGWCCENCDWNKQVSIDWLFNLLLLLLQGDKGQFELLSHSFHASEVTGLDICIRKPIVATCSVDRSVRIWNFETWSVFGLPILFIIVVLPILFIQLTLLPAAIHCSIAATLPYDEKVGHAQYMLAEPWERFLHVLFPVVILTKTKSESIILL